MKKVVFVLVLALFTVGGAFAQIQLSAGGGLHFDYEIAISDQWNNEPKIGGFVFFDATYGEVDLGYTMLGAAVSLLFT